MPDWTKSMQQSFEYYVVDPRTWKEIRRIDKVKSSTIERNSTSDTLGSANFDIEESLGECYIRVYLITIQNGVTERTSLGTFLAQTLPSSFDGKVRNMSIEAYTPLIELNENPLPIGYYTPKDSNTLDEAYKIVRDNARAPVAKTENDNKVYGDFISNTDDTPLTYVKDLLSSASFELGLDELSRILFSPKQNIASMQPIWTFSDDNSSILYPKISMDYDLYGIPNVVEVIYSKNGSYYSTRVVNDDSNSPLSTINRGREIVHRVMDPDLTGDPTKEQIDEYAEKLLKSLSSLEYTISYEHGYCPVRVGDCVRLDYKAAGITDVKAKVISQSIECTPGCKVTETAVFTKKLWEG